MSRQPAVQPTQDKWGHDHHPAYGVIGASRGTYGGAVNAGTTLFDSDIRHHQTITVTIQRAVDIRQGHQNRQHATQELIQVELSEAQWASFVSSMNVGSGVPCTVRRVAGEDMAGLIHSPRLAASMAEVHSAAQDAFSRIQQAQAELEALDPKAGVKARRAAMDKLKYAIQNATHNVDFAGEQLAKHAEDVVQKARADVEAMVVHKAAQIGVDPAELGTTMELTAGDEV